MFKKSNYIFFTNPDYETKKEKKKRKDNEIVLDFDSIRIKLKNALNLAQDAQAYGFFKYRYVFHYGECEATINMTELKVATYIEIQVTGKTQSKIIKCIEYFESKLEEINRGEKYIIIYSYDSVSEYYCNKMYPKLNELERNLRKLLFNTYTLNFGLHYYEATISNELVNKGKHLLKVKKGDSIRLIQELFYSFDYGQMSQLLFTPQWTEMDEKRKVKFLEENDDLSNLSDDALREAFNEFVPRTDWERLFSNKVPDDIRVDNLLNSIREDRNKVAHCKLFGYEDYKKCTKEVNELNTALLNAIEITESNDFSKKCREEIFDSINNVNRKIRNMIAVIAPALLRTIDMLSNNGVAMQSMIETVAKLGNALNGYVIASLNSEENEGEQELNSNQDSTDNDSSLEENLI